MPDEKEMNDIKLMLENWQIDIKENVLFKLMFLTWWSILLTRDCGSIRFHNDAHSSPTRKNT